MYRSGRKAYAHSNYIRPSYSHVWHEADRQAASNGVSLSEFVSHALYVFMTGREPADGKLTGRGVEVTAHMVMDQRATRRRQKR